MTHRTVGLIEPAGTPTHAVSEDLLAERDARVVRGSRAELPDPAELTMLIATSQAALRNAPTGVPILPVGRDTIAPAVDHSNLQLAIDRLLTAADGDGIVAAASIRTLRRVVLAVHSVDSLGRAIREVTLITDEPARISEFEISRPCAVPNHDTQSLTGAVGGSERIRADGVVIATPLGSHGYAQAAGGPTLAPETGLAVVPLAPFKIDPDRWVLPQTTVTCQVSRDGVPVAIDLDGSERGHATAGDTVTISVVGTLQLTVPVDL